MEACTYLHPTKQDSLTSSSVRTDAGDRIGTVRLGRALRVIIASGDEHRIADEMEAAANRLRAMFPRGD